MAGAQRDGDAGTAAGADTDAGAGEGPEVSDIGEWYSRLRPGGCGRAAAAGRLRPGRCGSPMQ